MTPFEIMQFLLGSYLVGIFLGLIVGFVGVALNFINK